MIGFPTAFTRAAILVCVAAAAWAVGPAHAAVTSEQIDTAILDGKKFVYSQQQAGGRWEHDDTRKGDGHNWSSMQGDSFGGYTALATYALLASGESPNSPRVGAAIGFLKRADIVGVYALGIRLQVWLLIPHETAEIKAHIHKDADALINGINMGPDGPGTNHGLWDYTGLGSRVDHSVSQYGVLGLWAAQQSGVVDVGSARWKLLEGAWRRDQVKGGGWSYESDGDPTIPMTAAGVASLFITADYLHAEDGIACTGTLPNPWIDRGLTWISDHFDEVSNDTYAMYGIERIGAASGYKVFAGSEWFSNITERLIKSQNPDGSWAGSYPGGSPLDATCFALLFLSRGRAPVLMNKLDYRTRVPAPPTTQGAPPAPPIVNPANWNERPRDVANLAVWVGHQTEIFRNWQIVNLQSSVDELHDAPVLYLSGNEALSLKLEDARKLKLFIQQGGTVIANADCGREAFAESFKALGKALFGGTFRELPPAHPVFTHQQFPAKAWKTRPQVFGLTNGVRELMILLPSNDVARWWQNPSGAAGHEDAFELGIDLCQYASDRQVWSKDVTYIVRPNPAIKPTRRLKVARLVAGPNWDPEPGGWSRLAAILHNEDQTAVEIFPAVPGQGLLAAAQIAHLTGTTAFTLSDAARLELKSFVDQGGTLVVDAAGGALPFADSAEQELKAIFGADAVRGLEQSLPANNPVYKLAEHPMTSFGYRPWARQNSVGALKDPRVKGITVGNRTAVFFSREDLSAGLVGQPVDGIIGYTPETATAIMRNVLLYSAAGRKPKPAGP